MWFKTRVALIRTDGPVEIYAHKDSATNRWAILASIRILPDGESRNLLGRTSFRSPTFYLALFRDEPDVLAEISAAMDQIAQAISANANLCDLGTIGHVDAWDDAWTQISWPSSPP
jgi:hypothetical protein